MTTFRQRRRNQKPDSILVLTDKTVDEILAVGGTRGWVLNPERAVSCGYVVCVRNENWDNRTDGAAHRAAFLVGRISGLRPVGEAAGSRRLTRFLIEISSFARVNVPAAWPAGVRNPVAYTTLAALGLDAAELTFEPIAVMGSATPRRAGLTIAEAKRGLAETFGVTPEDIDITIRG